MANKGRYQYNINSGAYDAGNKIHETDSYILYEVPQEKNEEDAREFEDSKEYLELTYQDIKKKNYAYLFEKTKKIGMTFFNDQTHGEEFYRTYKKEVIRDLKRMIKIYKQMPKVKIKDAECRVNVYNQLLRITENEYKKSMGMEAA